MAKLEGTPTSSGINDGHENRGSDALAEAFGTVVAAPVALHVQAKRWLATEYPKYRSNLSPDSVRSLELQGGPMEPWEAAAFVLRPHVRDAVRLRLWDDRAKLSHLHPMSQQVALAELDTLMAHAGRQADALSPDEGGARLRTAALTSNGLRNPQDGFKRAGSAGGRPAVDGPGS